jgi:lipopolysaccharide export system permease protein
VVRAQAKGDTPRFAARQFESGFWFRQEHAMVNIRGVLPDLTLVGVRIYEFDDAMRLAAMRVAESGTFAGNGQLRLKNVRVTSVGPGTLRVSDAAAAMWNTVLRPSLLTVYQVAPERLELGTLWDNMRLLSAGAQKATRFEIAFWNKIFYPAAVLVMMALALPFSYFQRRGGGIGFRIFAGTMLGLAFFLLGRLFTNLGVLNDWPPLFAAVFPLVAFVALAGVLLWKLERR